MLTGAPMSEAEQLLNDDLRREIAGQLPRYPTKQAATLPALHLVNEHLGYVPPQAVVEIAEMLDLSPAQVQDTLSFYGFFKQDKPLGRIACGFAVRLAARHAAARNFSRSWWNGWASSPARPRPTAA